MEHLTLTATAGKQGDIIRRHCLPEEPHNVALQMMLDNMDENLNYADASEILVATTEEMARQKAEFEDWSQYDKLTWIVRGAFLSGFLRAADIMLTQIEMAADDADKEMNTHG